MLRFMRRAHAAIGFQPARFRLSLRGENILGEAAQWDQAEAMLREALVRKGIQFIELAGEAAFYGPKIDFQVEDSASREWSLAPSRSTSRNRSASGWNMSTPTATDSVR